LFLLFLLLLLLFQASAAQTSSPRPPPGSVALAKMPKDPSREAMMDFLSSGVAMMKSDATRDLLKDRSGCKSASEQLVVLQRAGWKTLGFDEDLGCAALDKVDGSDPGNQQLLQLRADFVYTAMRTYLQAVVDRRPAELECKKPMPREAFIEFFDACNTKMDMPETIQILAEHMAATNKVPNELIINIQKDMLEDLGFERNHACAMLNRIPQDFPNDQELHQKFETWRAKAQATCMRVLKVHQISGGTLPAGPFSENPELRELETKARAELESMTDDQHGELAMRMQKRVQIFMNLPADGQRSWMAKLSEEDKLEFVKGQCLILDVMKEQWQEQQTQAKADYAKEEQDLLSGSTVSSIKPSKATFAPAQQTM